MVYFWYRLKRLLRNRSLFFWSIIFPIGLATFFFLAFGSITEKDTGFETISVAVVQNTEDKTLTEFLTEMTNGEEKFFALTEVANREEAEVLLLQDKVEAVILNGEMPTLLLSENGLSTTVVKTVLDGYLQSRELILEAMATGTVAQVAAALSEEVQVLSVREFEGASTDPMIQYFQALIAMASLYGAMYGLMNAQELRASTSALSARRVASPLGRGKMILADVAAAFVIQYLQFLLIIAYYLLVLRINFGRISVWLFLAGALFSLFGVVIGYFIGCVTKNERVQDSVMMSCIMFSCFLSGLMVGNMRFVLEQTMPIVNRINPATLIANCMHQLCIMGNKEGYAKCMIGIAVWCVCLIAGCFVVLYVQQKREERKGKAYEGSI